MPPLEEVRAGACAARLGRQTESEGSLPTPIVIDSERSFDEGHFFRS